MLLWPPQAVGFATREEAQAFLLANPDYALGAVHFVYDDPLLSSAQLQGFVIQTNTTVRGSVLAAR
jgi:hypothetical protein